MYPYYLYYGLPKLSEHKVWAEIDTEALKENYKRLCNLSPNAKHICVVKADAYGHACEICVKALLNVGCDFFAVSCIEEALAVRSYCQGRRADILILGYTSPNQAEKLVANDIIQTVISEEYAEALADVSRTIGCRPRVHIAIDTGMNRIGICAENDEECCSAIEFVSNLIKSDDFSVEGIFTHFAQADEEYEAAVAESSRTREQFIKFDALRSGLAKKGIVLFSHACNSAGALRFPEYSCDGIRLGISLYGVKPSEHFEDFTRPVMSLHAKISHIHTVSAGDKVSYGGKYAPDTDRTIATLPIGYADGFLRAFKGFSVTVETDFGKYKATVVGNVCMDQCMIDVTDIPTKVGDVVTVFGNDPEDISTLAHMADTIEYEILCLISARVPRIIKQEKASEDQL